MEQDEPGCGPGDEKRKAGRPRCERTHRAILAAAADALEEEGFAAATIEGIAARAGVGKQTIYRRWSCREALLLDAALEGGPDPAPLPDTGSARRDAARVVAAVSDELSTGAAARTLAGLVAACRENAELARTFRARFVAARRAALRAVLARGVSRGELSPELDVDAAADLLFAPVWYRHLVGDAPLGAAEVERVVGLAFAGLSPGGASAAG